MAQKFPYTDKYGNEHVEPENKSVTWSVRRKADTYMGDTFDQALAKATLPPRAKIITRKKKQGRDADIAAIRG